MAEGIREAAAGGERAGDATHLPAKGEMIFGGAETVGMGEGEIEDADCEADPEHAAGGWGKPAGSVYVSVAALGRSGGEESAECRAGVHRA